MKQWLQRFLIGLATLLLVTLVIPLAMGGEVQPVQGYGDVPPTNPEFPALRSVVERYGINVGFPDGTFRSQQPLTRGDFVMYLNDSMNQINELLSTSTADIPDLATINRDLDVVSQQFSPKHQAIATRITQIKNRLERLEAKVTSAKALENEPHAPANVQPILAKLPTPARSAVKDINPSDPYYAALQSILERYEINVVFPNLTFQGKQPLTRGDFAIYFDAALTRLDELQQQAFAPIRTAQQQLSQVQEQVTTNRTARQKEIELIKKRLNLLEQKLSR